MTQTQRNNWTLIKATIMNNLINIFKKGFAIPFLLLLVTNANAQTTELLDEAWTTLIAFGFVFVIALLVLFVAFYLLLVIKTIVKNDAIKRAEEEGREYVPEPSLWQELDRKLFTKAVAIEEEETIQLDHDYDGIRELDNHLPPWWKYLFYITIVFAVVYIGVYHVTGSMPLQQQEYENEIAMAEAVKLSAMSEDSSPTIDENNVVYSDDDAVLANGKKVFVMNCAPCHKDNGEGGIGPNLTDEYWLNGGSIKDIFKAVKYGFPDKGMISWEPLLSPQQMSDVTSFVKSIHGTNPPNAKGPQGEVYMEEEPTENASDTTVVDEAN